MSVEPTGERVKRFASYARAVQHSTQAERPPRSMYSEIKPDIKTGIRQEHRVISKASWSSIVSTSSTFTVLGDEEELGSKMKRGAAKDEVVDGEEESHSEAEVPDVTQACPQTKTDRSPKSTLGRLFTEAGFEQILIEILDCAPLNAMTKCLLVCKNANTIMVKSSRIQEKLRYLLYSFGKLPIPERHNELHPADPPSEAKDEATSKSRVANYCMAQRFIERTTYKRLRAKPVSLPINMADVQGTIILLDHGPAWSVINNFSEGLGVLRNLASSTLTLGAADEVVVESYGMIHQNLQALLLRPCDIKTSNPNSSSIKHPDAKCGQMTIAIQEGSASNSFIKDVPVRLYPGGFGALLVTEAHQCDAPTATGPAPKDKSSTRLVVFNWQRATGLGVVRIVDSDVKILDFRYLNDTQIVCSSIRRISGTTYPSIDIYEIPKTHVPVDETHSLIESRKLPTMPLIASFQLPALKNPQLSCLWSQPAKSYSYISDFAIRVPRPAGLSALIDQVMTFRLEGRIGGKTEKLQGAVLLSRLAEMIDKVVKAKAGGTLPNSAVEKDVPETVLDSDTSTNGSFGTPKVGPVIEDHDQVYFEWEQWSSAVSLSPSTSSTVLAPHITQVASIARSRNDKTKAVMVIRDYNQRMMYAPPRHLTRNLGHPTENCPSDGPGPKEEKLVERPFKPVHETRSIKSILFGGTVNYGLGHRSRTLSLGEYTHNTATSRLYWNDFCMMIESTTPGNSFELYPYLAVHDFLAAASDKNEGD